MRWRGAVLFAAVPAARLSLAAFQVAQNTCKKGGKIRLKISYDGPSDRFPLHPIPSREWIFGRPLPVVRGLQQRFTAEVYGENFRADDYVTLSTDDGQM